MRAVRGLRVAFGRGLHEAGAVDVVLMVEEDAAALPLAGRRVLRPYRRRLVHREHLRDGVYGLVLGVREPGLDRRPGGQLGAQGRNPGVPQAAEALRIVVGDAAGLPQLHPHQIDLGPGDEDVHLRAPPADGGYGCALPGTGALAGGHLRIGGPDAVLPGLRVGGAVGGAHGVLQVRTVGLVPAVGLPGGQIDGGDLDARRYGAAQVGVQEEEVVIGMCDDLEDGALGHARAGDRLGRRRLPGDPVSVGPGRHADDTDADAERGEQGREAGAAGQGHLQRLEDRSGAEFRRGDSRRPDGSTTSGDDRARLCLERLRLTHHQGAYDGKLN